MKPILQQTGLEVVYEPFLLLAASVNTARRLLKSRPTGVAVDGVTDKGYKSEFVPSPRANTLHIMRCCLLKRCVGKACGHFGWEKVGMNTRCQNHGAYVGIGTRCSVSSVMMTDRNRRHTYSYAAVLALVYRLRIVLRDAKKAEGNYELSW